LPVRLHGHTRPWALEGAQTPARRQLSAGGTGPPGRSRDFSTASRACSVELPPFWVVSPREATEARGMLARQRQRRCRRRALLAPRPEGWSRHPGMRSNGRSELGRALRARGLALGPLVDRPSRRASPREAMRAGTATMRMWTVPLRVRTAPVRTGMGHVRTRMAPVRMPKAPLLVGRTSLRMSSASLPNRSDALPVLDDTHSLGCRTHSATPVPLDARLHAFAEALRLRVARRSLLPSYRPARGGELEAWAARMDRGVDPCLVSRTGGAYRPPLSANQPNEVVPCE
jgi:hypothetical protein